MKKILLIITLFVFVACKKETPPLNKKSETALILIEFSGENYFSKDLIINLKENYLVYGNKGNVLAYENEEDRQSETIRFKLDKQDLKNGIESFKAINKGDDKAGESELHTSIEIVKEDRTFEIMQDGRHRLSGEDAFLKTILQLIDSKTQDEKIKRELKKFDLLMSKKNIT